MKKLILLPILVFGQFLAHAQKPANKAQQVITMNLLVAGSVHLPKTNNGKALGKDKNQTAAQDKVVLAQSQDVVVTTQVVEAVSDDKSNSGKKNAVLTTVSSL
ncbi:hypothetical protein A3860_38170 [Niastella vici]|uniref:TonB-dependent receptor n=1 Tax=Niastella vici TaxID=1703345 RepID=A0A1V9FLP0_9BACT|nr:hypothetical protein [Niastella vici]OQP59211.1 hypothetical protein A3860_38170 [Niastella vici]